MQENIINGIHVSFFSDEIQLCNINSTFTLENDETTQVISEDPKSCKKGNESIENSLQMIEMEKNRSCDQSWYQQSCNKTDFWIVDLILAKQYQSALEQVQADEQDLREEQGTVIM